MKVTSLFVLSLFVLLVSCKNKDSALEKETQPIAADVTPENINPPKKMEKLLKDLTTVYCMGQFDPKTDADFRLIPAQYADREGMYIRKDVFDAFKSMFEAAKKEGHKLQIRSATRNFNYQKGIWERKWTGATTLSDGTNVATDIQNPTAKALKILEYSSMPGTSRHHWGTDIDLNAFNNAYFEKGEGKAIYEWLQKNAATYGFCQPYTPKGPDRPHGYNEEKWHWSYKPLGAEITAFASQHLKNEMIKGFKGAETAIEIDVIGKYVLGINQRCNH